MPFFGKTYQLETLQAKDTCIPNSKILLLDAVSKAAFSSSIFFIVPWSFLMGEVGMGFRDGGTKSLSLGMAGGQWWGGDRALKYI